MDARQCFYQKHFPEDRPPAGVRRVPVRAASTGKPVHYVVGGTKHALLALANLGCIAMHVMNARVGSLQEPDWLAFDLDPSSGTFADAARAGLLLRRILDDLGLPSYPKTSGSRGLHVFVPLRRGQPGDAVTACSATPTCRRSSLRTPCGAAPAPPSRRRSRGMR